MFFIFSSLYLMSPVFLALSTTCVILLISIDPTLVCHKPYKLRCWCDSETLLIWPAARSVRTFIPKGLPILDVIWSKLSLIIIVVMCSK